jgi:hypothetical protein
MTEKLALYLIGQPGSGKTSVLQGALRGLAAYRVSKPLAHTVYTPTWGSEHVLGVELGFARPPHGGTDVLAMGAQPLAEAFVHRLAAGPVLLGEGDRLANAKFFAAVMSAGFVLTVAWLDTPDEVAASRRDGRGSSQSPSWIKGRQTKVRRLAEGWSGTLLRLDGSLPLPEVIASLKATPALLSMHAFS